MNYVLKNVDNINVTSNESVNRHVLNRNFEKLLENDIALDSLKREIKINTDNISEWNKDATYNKGDYVWFKQESNDGIIGLYLLRSLISDNKHKPELKENEGLFGFEESGWQDNNSYSTQIQNNISSYIITQGTEILYPKHTSLSSMHKFGELTEKQEENEKKLLKTNFENINNERQNNFFPYETAPLKKDNTIINGFYRKWDSGLLEYDIIYRLGYVGNEKIDGLDFQSIYCNNFKISNTNLNGENYSDVTKYFKSAADYDIFDFVTEDRDYVKINYTVQRNRHKYTNAYSGTINFPIPFINRKYMIFDSDIMVQCINTNDGKIDHGDNTVVYVDKKTLSISPLLIVFNKNNVVGSNKSGLITNTFHCQIVGRWK